ncbi:MAG: hypothetical protein ACOCQM_02170 [Natronomonas sp.]
MFPLQTISDPAMAVVVLTVVMTLVVFLAFIWAYGKIREPPEEIEDHEGGNGHGA